MGKKIKNERCPLQNECERKCENIGTELKCDYYRNNGIGDKTIPDQEELRNQLETLKAHENYENEIAALPDDDDETERRNEAKLVYISVDMLEPHPDNPRKDLGDLTELADSIKVKGVMQNLTVVPFKSRTNPKFNGEGRYTVIIGHRRLGAAKLAGLTELPCVITEMTEQEQIETMLLENMQRSDLTVYEQAQGFQMMVDFGDDISAISEKTGFSETTIRRRIKLCELPPERLKMASEKQITITELDRLAKIENPNTRALVLAAYGTNNYENEYAKAIKAQQDAADEARWREIFARRGVTEIPKEDLWSGKYGNAGKWFNLSALESALDGKLIEGRQNYFCLNYGTFYIRHEIVKTTDTPPTKEEIAQAECREKENARRDAVREATARAYRLRRDYICGMSERQAKEHFPEVVKHLSVLNNIGLSNDPDAYELLRLYNVDLPDPYDADEELTKFVLSCPYKALLGEVYLMSGDDDRTGYDDWLGKYEENEHLDDLYGFLCAIGYEMSDDERQLRDGTHPLFVDKDNPEE